MIAFDYLARQAKHDIRVIDMLFPADAVPHPAGYYHDGRCRSCVPATHCQHSATRFHPFLIVEFELLVAHGSTNFRSFFDDMASYLAS